MQTSDFKVGQKVKVKNNDRRPGNMNEFTYGEIVKVTPTKLLIKWDDLEHPVAHRLGNFFNCITSA